MHDANQKMKNIIKSQKFSFILVIILMLAQVLNVQSQVMIGNNAEGTLTDPPASTMCAIRYQCSQDMAATKMYAKIAVSGSGTVKCAIYSDDSGNPGIFLMGTNELTNPGTGWKSFDLTSGLALTSGTWYHLVLWTDNTGYMINYTADGVGTPCRPLAYGAWPGLFGTTRPWPDGTYCMYAEGEAVCINPAITAQPQSIDQTVGTLATFNITATGTSLSYQWKKGGTNISGQTLSSYTISSVVTGDAGNYTVVVSGACGSPVASDTAILTICVNPVAITAQPQSIGLAVGTIATFSVTATGTGLTYQWEKGGTDIAGATGSSYTISSVTNGNAGDYTVVVSGECGSSVTSNVANLAIADPNDYIIQGETFVDTTERWLGVIIDNSTKKAFYFLNNSVTSQGTGYLLHAGDEVPAVTNNNLDGSIITGNQFLWKGTDMKAITHGMFMGYNINNLVKYNYLKGVPYAMVSKSSGMACTSGGVAYNIVINAMKGATAKGISGVRFFNNTFYSSRTMAESNGYGQINISVNDDAGSPGFVSTDCKVFNNIFYTKYQIFNIAIDQRCLPGFECDYNIYYCESGDPLFYIPGQTDAITFKQWQALGYDKHSVVVNPKFISDTFIPSVPLFKGKDLGDEWKQGLSPSAEWGKSAPAVANQDSSIWQCGAYIVSPAPTANYYVAPYGNDNNIGDITHPFATLNKVWTKIKSGDLVYLRGGRYAFNTQQVLTAKYGTSLKLIKVWAYPGETPVISKGTGYSVGYGVYFHNNSYIHLKGWDISGYTQDVSAIYSFGITVSDCNNCTFEQINCYNNGYGFDLKGLSTDNLILNSDFHHNYDPYTEGELYGVADGLGINTPEGSTNTVRGCRSWSNSDDGYDHFRSNGNIITENCWAWHNGYKEDGITDGGDGTGFKLGITLNDYSTQVLRTVQNCLSFNNRNGGIYQNGAECIMHLYNNTTYSNRGAEYTAGIGFGDRAGIEHVVRNNIVFDEMLAVSANAESIHDHNTWNSGFSVSSSDFLSLDSTGVSGPRQADGNLPKLDFLKLSSTSKLINSGVDVGLPFNGTAPDLGAIETGPLTSSSSLEIQNDDFLVYPNPVNDILYISSTKGDVKGISLKLFDIRGIELYGSTEAGDCTLDISKYQPGIYFLQIICEGKTTIRKIMKY